MTRDAQRMRVPFPEDSAHMHADLLRLVKANEASNATLRVAVVRNRGGMWEGPAAQNDYDVVAFTSNVQPWGESVKLGVVPNGRHAASEFAGTKYLSWSENLMRYERAHEQGYDEVILLNERGEVAECTSANVFAVTGNRVTTPPVTAGCLPGVTRAVLFEEIHVPGIEVGEQVMFPADLEKADEVFITSTTRELLPVTSIEGLKIRQGRRVRDLLQQAFSAYVADYVKSHHQA